MLQPEADTTNPVVVLVYTRFRLPIAVTCVDGNIFGTIDAQPVSQFGSRSLNRLTTE